MISKYKSRKQAVESEVKKSRFLDIRFVNKIIKQVTVLPLPPQEVPLIWVFWLIS